MTRWLACLLLLAGSTASAQTAPHVSPRGDPQVAHPPRDAEFGVRTRQFGLQRRVEMYQWRKLGPGYAKVWSERPIDSSAHAEGYRNPAGFPLRTRYWIADEIRVDGRPLDEDVLKEIGAWRGFRPDFSALPGNLAATFQPEGDGLGSAENPLDPRIGDLRVNWRELTLPPLAGRVVLERGEWRLAAAPARATARQDAVASPSPAVPGRKPGLPVALLVGIGAVLLAAAAALRRRGRKARA